MARCAILFFQYCPLRYSFSCNLDSKFCLQATGVLHSKQNSQHEQILYNSEIAMVHWDVRWGEMGCPSKGSFRQWALMVRQLLLPIPVVGAGLVPDRRVPCRVAPMYHEWGRYVT